MWSGETVFSGGDLTSGELWVQHMLREYGAMITHDDETRALALTSRRQHVQELIDRLQEELSRLDELALLFDDPEVMADAQDAILADRSAQTEADLSYLDGPWRNDSCKGYVIAAMRQQEAAPAQIHSMMASLEEAFSDLTTEEASEIWRSSPY